MSNDYLINAIQNLVNEDNDKLVFALYRLFNNNLALIINRIESANNDPVHTYNVKVGKQIAEIRANWNIKP